MSSPQKPREGSPNDSPEYVVDLHGATLFVPARRLSPRGTVLRVRLELNRGVAISGLAKVESVHEEERAGRPPGMELRLLEVQPALGAREGGVSLRPPSLRPSQMPGPVRVLVVDDDLIVRTGAAATMRDAGYEVLEAKNGAEAITIAVQQQVSLILTDVNMPVMDGWQFLRMVRARDELADIAVIFLTSLTNEAERFRGYSLGVDDYIDKPFEPEILISRVERALIRRMQPHEESAALHGDLSRVGLPNLLSLLELERRTGRLELRSEGLTGRVLLREGRAVRLEIDHALAPDDPMDRFYAMLGWQEGEFDLFHEQVSHDDDIGVSISHVLLEMACLEDEAKAEEDASVVEIEVEADV